LIRGDGKRIINPTHEDLDASLWGEPTQLETCFRSLAKASSPSHGQWTDAYLASFAIESQAQLVTFDQGFSRFSGLDLFLLS